MPELALLVVVADSSQRCGCQVGTRAILVVVVTLASELVIDLGMAGCGRTQQPNHLVMTEPLLVLG